MVYFPKGTYSLVQGVTLGSRQSKATHKRISRSSASRSRVRPTRARGSGLEPSQRLDKIDYRSLTQLVNTRLRRSCRKVSVSNRGTGLPRWLKCVWRLTQFNVEMAHSTVSTYGHLSMRSAPATQDAFSGMLQSFLKKLIP